MAPVSSFEDLEVWRKAIDFTEDVYRATASWPKDERFGLTSQIRRAAASVAANISEGAARTSTKDFLRFVGISKGSIAELKTFLIIAERLSYLDKASSMRLQDQSDEIGRMLSGLANALHRKI